MNFNLDANEDNILPYSVANSLHEAENDGLQEKTQPLKLFSVSQETAAQQIPNMLNSIMNFTVDTNRPLFMLVRYKPWYFPNQSDYYYYGGRPGYVSFRFTFENFFNLMHAIAHPFQTYYDATEEIRYSDFLIKIDKGRLKEYQNGSNATGTRNKGDPQINEVTHVGFFSTPKERENLINFMKPWNKFNTLVYKSFEDVYIFDKDIGTHRATRKGLFLPYAFKYDKLIEYGYMDDICTLWFDIFSGNNQGAFDDLLELQIPWGREELLKEEGNAISDEIFSQPCLLYALKGQVSEEVYKKLQDEKIIFGVGAKVHDFKKILYNSGYIFDIYRVQDIKNEDRFKINVDHYKPNNSNCAEYKLIKLMYWEGHWMKYKDHWLRRLEKTKRLGFLRHLNAFEFAQVYDNQSFDRMIKFNEKEYIRTHEDNYHFTEIDYENLESGDSKVPKNIYFADFEASVNETFHVPYLVCCSKLTLTKNGNKYDYINSDDYFNFWGKECARQFLLHLLREYGVSRGSKAIKTVRIYFYNLHYDFTFIQPYVQNISRIMKGRNLYSVTADYSENNMIVKLDFWDALPIFRSTLKKAAENYLTSEQKATIKKEVLPYELYTYDFFEQNPDYCPKAIFLYALDDKINKVDDSLIEKYSVGDDLFDYKGYVTFYCQQDVRCLKHIMLNFDSLLTGGNVEGINGVLPFCMPIWKYRTASTIGYEYFKATTMFTPDKKPLHDWAIPKCALRHFIQQTIRGGRVMTRDNKTWYYKAKGIDDCLQDYDGVSLYPSAMSLLWLTEGAPIFIKGSYDEDDITEFFTHPNAFPNQFKRYNDGCIHVTYINVHKERHFPLLCIKDPKTGLNNYQNFHGNVDTWVNVIDLFNLIEFQEAEIKWDCAIVWEGKRYYEIRDNIQRLFEFRANNKKHPIQMVIKLILNSIFGKSILKPQNTEKLLIEKYRCRFDSKKNVYVQINAWDEFFNANAYRIHRFEELDGGLFDVEVYKRDMSASFNIFGSNVLAMARRIIGRVMALAEDIEEKNPELSPGLFYTDTDSMHIRKDLLTKLEIEFKNKYHSDIKGNNLTQFHVDFDPPENFKEDEKVIGACESYFLMKKVYADKLLGDKGSIDYHMRMKGVPIDLVKYEDYKKIADGESVTFDLLKGHTSFFFQNGKVGSRVNMTREIMLRETRDKRKRNLEINNKNINKKIKA